MNELNVNELESKRVKVTAHYLTERENLHTKQVACKEVFDVARDSTLREFKGELRLIEQQKKFVLKQQTVDDRICRRNQKKINKARRKRESKAFKAYLNALKRAVPAGKENQAVNPPIGDNLAVAKNLVTLGASGGATSAPFPTAGACGTEKVPRSLASMRGEQ
jgi:hypothetical protein